jgi:hypothetical protein
MSALREFLFPDHFSFRDVLYVTDAGIVSGAK